MNRGQGKHTISHGEAYTDALLACLAETHGQFGLEVLAYCLINNHYRLLVRAPSVNLSRCIHSVKHLPRQIALYLCQQHSGVTLKQIAEFFSVGSYFTVSKVISRLRYEMELDTTLRRDVDGVCNTSIVQ